MRRKPNRIASEETPAVRLAFGVAFATTLLLMALLGFVRSAEAATVPSPVATASFSPAEREEEAEEDEAGEEAEEGSGGETCAAESEEEAETCEAELEEAEEAEELEACRLSEAEATVLASPGNGLLHLAVHYRSYSPATVRVGVRFHGGKGSGNLGQSSAHFRHAGTFRETIELDQREMARALAAREFTVTLRAAGAPGYCSGEFDQQLNARHAVGAGLLWSDPGSPRSYSHRGRRHHNG